MKRRLFIMLLLFVTWSSQAQIITTIAGTGVAGYSGDGGPASVATLWNPAAIAFDTAGNLLVSELLNFRVRKIDGAHADAISTIIGNGTFGYSGDGGAASAAQISVPHGLIVDVNGSIYLTANSNHVIRKINNSGVISNFAGTGIMGYSGDGGQATNAKLNRPRTVKTDKVGNLYVTDVGNNCIRKIDTSGIITTVAGTGVAGFSGDGGAATAAKLNGPTSIALDSIGNLYVYDDSNFRVRKISTAGIITTIAGVGTLGSAGDGGPATAAQLNGVEIAFDNNGNLFIVDYNRIREVIAQTGITTTVVGDGTGSFIGDGGPASAAEIFGPHSIVFDKAGNLFITDLANQRVRKVTMPVITIASSVHDTICAGTHVVFTATVTNDAMPPIYQWKVNSLNVGADTSVYVTDTLHNGDTVSCVLTYFFGDTNRRVSNRIIITVDSFPPSAGSIEGGDYVCVGSSIPLIVSSTGGVWRAVNSRATVSTTSGVVTGVSPGADTIVYRVANACGADSVLHIVTVKPCNAGVLPAGQREELIDIYPNPNEGDFTILLLGNAEPAYVTVTNLLGEKVKEIVTATDKAEVRLDVPGGVYFVSTVLGGSVYYRKIVVKR